MHFSGCPDGLDVHASMKYGLMTVGVKRGPFLLRDGGMKVRLRIM